MPNYVKNQIRWQGPQDDEVLDCMFRKGADCIDFNIMVPLSAGEEEDSAVRKEKWGSVYKPFSSSVERVNGETHVMIETGWLTPLPWAQKLSAQFPEDIFRLDYESGGGYGTYVFRGGESRHVDWDDDDYDKACAALEAKQPVHVKIEGWS